MADQFYTKAHGLGRDKPLNLCFHTGGFGGLQFMVHLNKNPPVYRPTLGLAQDVHFLSLFVTTVL